MVSQDGDYERDLKASLPPIDDLSKRLLTAMHLGIAIYHGDGHRWITQFAAGDIEEGWLDARLVEKKLPAIRSKVYGSVLEALDRIDGALQALGEPSLLEQFNGYPEAWGF